MKVFLAGGSGALGVRLVPELVRRGHLVSATTRSPSKIKLLQSLGAEPVILDALDKDAVLAQIQAARPEIIIHQMTALAGMGTPRNFDRAFAQTNLLRSRGTANLLAAARACGVKRMVAQSFAGWPSAPRNGELITEEDPPATDLPKTMLETQKAIQQLESHVTHEAGIAGTVLRYGFFYGPGTAIAAGGDIVQAVRRRALPLVGNGTGVWSFVHLDDAASATIAALENSVAGVLQIVDDEPAAVAEWLPELARILGAREPWQIPAWLARWLIGQGGVYLMTRTPGVSNAKAKQFLGWRPAYPSWREGFARSVSVASTPGDENAGRLPADELKSRSN